ncbi:MAG: murein biosynthesis integral membrane protein MurJ [Epulopiscium sp. Nuni2H_MBin003]|nr:MAG: murein biosynthesis integral membrane protein MurJ [Epulopiscium sp. Nuni2H_MBin003]
MNYNKAVRVAGFMTVITILSKILGLLREMVLAYIYGSSYVLTAFLAASKIPLTLFDITIGGVITSAFIPIFSELTQDKDKANRFASEYLNLILIITITLTLLGVTFAVPLINFTLSGDNIAEETLVLATNLSRIMFGMIIFTGIAYTFVGILNCYGQFYITSILSLVSNGIIILYLMVNSNIYGLSIVMVISWAFQVIVQLPFIYKYGFRYKKASRLITPEIHSTINLAIPILISSWAYPLSSLINMKMASYLHDGKAVVAMELANRLYVVISGIFAYVISNLSYPYLSKIANDNNDMIKLIRILIKSITFIIMPIMIGLIVLGHPIVSLAYERGNFTKNDSMMTANALIGMGFGMLSFSYNEIQNKIFYSIKNAKVPMYSGMFGIIVSIVLSIILPRYLDIFGLGLAVAIGTTTTSIINFYNLYKKFPRVLTSAEYLEIFKCFIATMIMGYAVSLIINVLEANILLAVIGSTIIGAIIYLVVCIVFRVNILMEFLIYLKKGRLNGK